MKKIYGIGTGPGAEEMLTLKAVRVLKEVDYIFAPLNEGRNRALDTIKDLIDEDKLVYLDFPMLRVNEDHYIENAKVMEDKLQDGQSGAFITIGDVMFYSTVINSLSHFSKDVEVEFVSGIPSFVAAASQAGIPLAFTGESLLVIDHIPDRVDDTVGTMAILKAYKPKAEDLDKIESLGFDYTYIQRATYDQEKILTRKEDIIKEEDYISLILARRK